MKCPNCNSELKECHMYLHHVICDNCKYEEKDIFVINKGKNNIPNIDIDIELTDVNKFKKIIKNYTKGC